ncbi:MAG TPA: hypothetical protein DE042_04290 [Colwellia sp.]|mgnify:CR=1 FL=1|nr:hypothetical protein [Colwellia sp.]
MRVNYFGEPDVVYFGNDHIGLQEFLSPTGSFKPTSTVEASVLIDVNVDYKINDNFNVSFTVNNIFYVTPDD